MAITRDPSKPESTAFGARPSPVRNWLSNPAIRAALGHVIDLSRGTARWRGLVVDVRLAVAQHTGWSRERKAHGKSRPLTGLARDVDRTAVSLNDASHYEKSKANP